MLIFPNFLAWFSCWIFLFLWVFLTPQNPGNYGRSNLSDELRLRANRQLMTKYIERRGQTPESLRHLQASSKGRRVFIVDQAGNRLQYVPLDNKSWLIRSFGFDGILNSLLNANDAYVASWSTEVHGQGLSFSYKKPPHLYPAGLLLGYFSPDRSLKARLFHHPDLGTSSLVVHQNQGQDFVNLAFHDRIEEFYWLPNSKMIVFTASDSQRYKGGIFLWNLQNNETQKVFPFKDMLPGQKEGGTSAQFGGISLAGFDQASSMMYAFVKGRESTSPEQCLDFFSQKSLRVFHLSDSDLSYDPKETHRAQQHTVENPPLNTMLPSSEDCLRAYPLQELWCKLPVSGAFEDAIQSWQSFTEEAASSPLFSHGLFVLSALYLDVLHLWEAHPSQTMNGEFYANEEILNDPEQVKDVLAAYGAELVQVLKGQNMAPSWVNLIGDDFWELLLAGQSSTGFFQTLVFSMNGDLTRKAWNYPTKKKTDSVALASEAPWCYDVGQSMKCALEARRCKQT